MLAIDLTPTVVNRTAIFHIALDTGGALISKAKKYRYGRSYVEKPITDRMSLDALRNHISREIFSTSGLAKEQWLAPWRSINRRPNSVSKILFFDPLYTLFEDVRIDDIVLVLDLSTVTNPEWHDPRVADLYKIAFRKIAAIGAKIASISESTAKALWANYGIPTDEITIVPLYLRRAFGNGPPQTADQKEKVLLFVGSLETRKNIHGLINAFSVSKLAHQGFRLVIVGDDGMGAAAIKSLASRVRGVELRGFVSDIELNHLYKTSRAFVYPSYLEGFGVPILEAASAGLPILTSGTGATREIAPPGSILVDPYDPHAISNGLKLIASISDAELATIESRNHQHAKMYSFERYFAVISSLVLQP